MRVQHRCSENMQRRPGAIPWSGVFCQPDAAVSLVELLPDALIGPIVGQWLCLSSVASLDSAFCNRRARVLFLNVLHSPSACSEDGTSLDYSNGSVEWALQRGMMFSRLYFFDKDCRVHATHVQEILQLSVRSVKELILYYPWFGHPSFDPFNTIVTQCYHLESVEFGGTSFKRNYGQLIRNNPQLRTLKIYAWCFKNDPDWQQLTNCRHMTHLSLPQSTIIDAALLVLVQNLSRLVHLDLEVCYELTDAGIAAALAYCSLLTDLNVSRTNERNDASAVEEALILCNDAAAAPANKRMCGALSLAELCRTCRNLTTLNLHGCEALTDAVLGQIVTAFPGLSTLNIAFCPALTPRILPVVARGCRQLRLFTLSLASSGPEGGNWLGLLAPTTEVCYEIDEGAAAAKEEEEGEEGEEEGEEGEGAGVLGEPNVWAAMALLQGMGLLPDEEEGWGGGGTTAGAAGAGMFCYSCGCWHYGAAEAWVSESDSDTEAEEGEEDGGSDGDGDDTVGASEDVPSLDAQWD